MQLDADVHELRPSSLYLSGNLTFDPIVTGDTLTFEIGNTDDMEAVVRCNWRCCYVTSCNAPERCA